MAWTKCPNPKFTGEPQSIASMCWFAGYTMLFRWKGMTESEIKPFIWKSLEASEVDVAEAKRGGLKLKDNRKAAKALGLGATGYGQPVSEHNLREKVRNSPVWATGRWFEETNHVYVIVGISETQVEYYDPWYDTSPMEALESHTTTIEWILNGDGNKRKGLAHTFQYYPLQYFKSGE